MIVISSLADERHFESAVERGMAVVRYDCGATPGKRSSVGHVMPDNFAAAKLAARHLIANGHKQLAFATVAGMTMSRSAKIDGFYAAIDAAGLRVPQDMSVVGIDGHFLSTLSNPMSTTVQLPVPEMAQAMVDRVMNPHPDPDNDPRKTVFAPSRLIQRESVARPALAVRTRATRGRTAA